MNKKKRILEIVIMLFLATCGITHAQTLISEMEAIADIVVDINGSGDYTSVQAAFNAVADNSTDTTVIFVKSGIYQEKVILKHTKHNVVLVGEDVDSTMITWDDWGDKMLPGGHTFSTYTFRADPHGFQAYNIQFNNPTTKGQGVAYHSNGDKQLLYHCRLTGNQDTYFDNFRTRRYIKDCYIEGTVDFIFGFGVTLFDSCQVQNLSRGYSTASSTPQYYEFGHVFKDCRVTTDKNVSNASLGRPWFAYANTTFYECWMSDGIIPAGWSIWANTSNHETCIYNEYKCFGAGADTTKRANFVNQLDDEIASRYTVENIMSASNFPSDLGDVVDSLEFWSMRNRFEASGYTDRADTILFAGRDYWPEYPNDNWTPKYNDKIRNIIDKYTVPFIDSANYNTNIAEIKYEGKTLEFSPDVKEYVIELEGEVTEVPMIEVIPEDPNANIEIIYPETLPGVITVNVSSYDRSHFDQYTIYNSVNGSYNNALLDSVILKGVAVPNFDPEVFEYDFVLPQGSSKYFSIKIHKQVEDATHKLVKLKTLPGEMTITVTSYSGLVSNIYKINVTVSTGIDELVQSSDISVKYLTDRLKCAVNSKESGPFAISIFDLNGKVLLDRRLGVISGEQELDIPVDLSTGIYLYKVKLPSGSAEGKIQVK